MRNIQEALQVLYDAVAAEIPVEEHAGTAAAMLNAHRVLISTPSEFEKAEQQTNLREDEVRFTYDDMIAYGRLCWKQSRQTWPSDLEPMPAISSRYGA